ncbi:60S acidic ribosomal protein P1 [Artemisia annua]|uniref:60S acidic ribosomal protein P1 n=1 Tax=Artemisia annua TaxID=35608 RepID=A0A2U1MF61_ARTAN|nr:60S acidic ribosomal protein P1 [Artemisia annua]
MQDFGADKIATLVSEANMNIESYWPGLFAKLCDKKSLDDLIINISAGGGGVSDGAAQGLSSQNKKKRLVMELRKSYPVKIRRKAMSYTCEVILLVAKLFLAKYPQQESVVQNMPVVLDFESGVILNDKESASCPRTYVIRLVVMVLDKVAARKVHVAAIGRLLLGCELDSTTVCANLIVNSDVPVAKPVATETKFGPVKSIPNQVKETSFSGDAMTDDRCDPVLIFPLYELQYMAMNRSSCIHQLMGYFPKLQQLNFHFSGCKVLSDADKSVLLSAYSNQREVCDCLLREGRVSSSQTLLVSLQHNCIQPFTVQLPGI